MSSRPAIPLEVQRELLFECRYRCACDCEPVSLEKAHIIPWGKTHDHSAANLVVLCGNCHTRSHVEKWPESQLRRFKQSPCALERDRLPAMSAEQKGMVDFVIAANVETMTDRERQRFAMMAAAYVGVTYHDISIVAVTPSKGSLVRLEMPRSAAEKLIQGFQARDPRLDSFLDEFALPVEHDLASPLTAGSANEAFGLAGGIKLVEAARPTPAEKPPVTNVREEGLESLIVDAMTSFGWIAGTNVDYDREHADRGWIDQRDR
jgi:type I restriction enzyme R subunit